MKASVRAAFVPFTSDLEGVVPWMYLDVRGLVTVAIGNLVDPLPYALPLPFVRRDGSQATRDEIADEWELVKTHPTAARQGHRVLKDVTQLRLTSEGIQKLVEAKLDQNWKHLAGRFEGLEGWPADAQLGLLSMAWALGPAFRWPMLEAALRARNFGLAAVHCTLREEGNPGVRPRNVRNRVLFRNAGRVHDDGLDPEPLYWPRDLLGPVDRGAETLRALPEDEPSSRRLPEVADFAIVHPRVPLRGDPGDGG